MTAPAIWRAGQCLAKQMGQHHRPPPKKCEYMVWIKRFRLLGLHFAVSNGRIKKRIDRPEPYRASELKKRLSSEQGWKCKLCGCRCDKLEMHHVLPWARFPEMRWQPDNIVMLCPSCHREIHGNPWKYIRMMEAKAEEMGVKLESYYDYG